MKRVGECLRCGMCCGDDENGYCEHLKITGKIGEPEATTCLIYGQLEKGGREGCKAHPDRAEVIYPWYKCGYRFVADGS